MTINLLIVLWKTFRILKMNATRSFRLYEHKWRSRAAVGDPEVTTADSAFNKKAIVEDAKAQGHFREVSFNQESVFFSASEAGQGKQGLPVLVKDLKKKRTFASNVQELQVASPEKRAESSTMQALQQQLHNLQIQKQGFKNIRNISSHHAEKRTKQCLTPEEIGVVQRVY